MLKDKLEVWVATLVVCLSLVTFGVVNKAHATEECWVDLAEPYGVVNVADVNALINDYVTVGGFDFDQDGQPEFDDHNGDGVYNYLDVYSIWYEYVDAWYDAYYNGCAPVQQSKTLPPNGGFVVTENYSAAVVVPAGALPAATEVTVTTLTDGPFTNWGEFTAYEFGPDGMQFAEPVTLYISYAGMNVTNPLNLRIVTYVAGEWQPVETISVDTANQYVIGLTSHFSTYAVAEDAQNQYALGGSCSGHDEPKRLPVDNMYETCGLNGRGNIIAECVGSVWSEYSYSDHVVGPLKDEPDHICWHRPSSVLQTGQSCLDETPSSDEYTCYDLDKCVAGAPDACSGHGTCTLLEITDSSIEKIEVANPDDFPGEVSGNLLTHRWDCVCDEANNFFSDGEGNCNLDCPEGYIGGSNDVCILECDENYRDDGDGICMFDCFLDTTVCGADQCQETEKPGFGICCSGAVEGSECILGGAVRGQIQGAGMGTIGTDSMGNIYRAGNFYDVITLDGVDIDPQNGADVYLVKYDHNGDHVWNTTIGNGKSVYFNHMFVDATGAVVLAGSFDGTLDLGVGQPLVTAPPVGWYSSNYDAFVVKYDSEGVPVWRNQVGSEKGDRAEAVAVGPDNSVILSGRLNSSVYHDNPEEFFIGEKHGSYTTSGDGQTILVKFDGNGDALWSQRFERGSFYDIAVNNANDIILAGGLYQTIQFGAHSITADTDNVLVVSLDADGGYNWSDNFGGSGINNALSVALNDEQDVIVTGLVSGSDLLVGGQPYLNTNGYTDSYILRYGSAGNLEHFDVFSGPWWNAGRSIAVGPDNEVFLAGVYRQEITIAGETLTAETGGDLDDGGGYGVYVAKFNASDELQWTSYYGITPYSGGPNLAMGSDGNVFLGGTGFEGGLLSIAGWD